MVDLEPSMVIIKPDGVYRGLMGPILTKLSETKLDVVAVRMMRTTRALAEEHYRQLIGKSFFEETVKYLAGDFHIDHVLVLVYYGENAIQKIRDVVGATNPEKAAPRTIRAMYGRIRTEGVYENVVHASSDPEEAEREIKLWLNPEDILVDLYPTVENDKGNKKGYGHHEKKR